MLSPGVATSSEGVDDDQNNMDGVRQSLLSPAVAAASEEVQGGDPVCVEETDIDEDPDGWQTFTIKAGPKLIRKRSKIVLLEESPRKPTISLRRSPSDSKCAGLNSVSRTPGRRLVWIAQTEEEDEGLTETQKMVQEFLQKRKTPSCHPVTGVRKLQAACYSSITESPASWTSARTESHNSIETMIVSRSNLHLPTNEEENKVDMDARHSNDEVLLNVHVSAPD